GNGKRRLERNEKSYAEEKCVNAGDCADRGSGLRVRDRWRRNGERHVRFAQREWFRDRLRRQRGHADRLRGGALRASLNSGTAFEIAVTALSDSTATFNRDGILAATSSVIHNIVSGNSNSGLTVVNSVYGSNTITG